MKPYGRRKNDELEYQEWGPPSRERKMKGKGRKSGRREMHRQARADSKYEIYDEMDDDDFYE
jgi:hypothetical protein